MGRIPNNGFFRKFNRITYFLFEICCNDAYRECHNKASGSVVQQGMLHFQPQKVSLTDHAKKFWNPVIQDVIGVARQVTGTYGTSDTVPKIQNHYTVHGER